MCCCFVLSRAVLRCAVLLQAQVNALVAENESLHEQLAKATSRLADASAASRAATATVTTDADKARFQVRLSLEGGASWLGSICCIAQVYLLPPSAAWCVWVQALLNVCTRPVTVIL
jgi:hypothetical protein